MRDAEQRVESQYVNNTTSVQFYSCRLEIRVALSLSFSLALPLPPAWRRECVIEKVFRDCSRVAARAVTCCGRWGMIKVCRLCARTPDATARGCSTTTRTTYEQDCAADRCAGLWANPRLLHMSYQNFKSSRFLTAVLLPKPTHCEYT